LCAKARDVGRDALDVFCRSNVNGGGWMEHGGDGS
jgi:hypothetical protein